MDFAAARAVADAVLYEGYLLFPYTASSRKNQMRWQFGVVVPLAYEAAGTGEHGEQQTDVLCETPGVAKIDVVVRFLHIVARTVEAAQPDGGFSDVESLRVDGTKHVRFDETVERSVALQIGSSSLGLGRPSGDLVRVPLEEQLVRVPFAFQGERRVEMLADAAGNIVGRIVRECRRIEGTLEATLSPVEASLGTSPSTVSLLRRLRVRLANHSQVVPARERSGVLRTAFVSAHTLMGASECVFLSPIDPPAYAAEATKSLENRHTWPVLVGDEKADAQRAAVVLSSPIVLGDFPQVAPQTDTDHFDAAEIDELLTLGIGALSDEERAEARATDPRAAALVDRAERFDAQTHARIHSASMQSASFEAVDEPSAQRLEVQGVSVAPGSSVRLHPKRRADAWDMFLVDKVATVRKIHQDLEDKWYVAVTIDDDPASDLHEWYGRSFFFEPDEVEPLGPAP